MSKANQKGTNKIASEQDKVSHPKPAVSTTPNANPEQSSQYASGLTIDEMLNVIDEMLGFKKPGTPISESSTEDTSTQSSSNPEKAHIPLGERSYLKRLNAKPDFSRAGQGFVMSFPKRRDATKPSKNGKD